MKQIFVLLAIFTQSLFAACPQLFLNGKEPTFLQAKQQDPNDKEVCFEVFAVYHSAKSLTPLWSAEHLTKENLDNEKLLPSRKEEKNEFHAEPSIPEQYRAELADYVKSGFDRGHMSPFADMPTENARYESFSLANMIPQAPQTNRVIWEHIETVDRSLAHMEGNIVA
jgi:endonuclease G